MYVPVGLLALVGLYGRLTEPDPGRLTAEPGLLTFDPGRVTAEPVPLPPPVGRLELTDDDGMRPGRDDATPEGFLTMLFPPPYRPLRIGLPGTE